MSIETVQIEKLIYGGDGLARLASGQIAFVPFSIPNESCQIDVTLPSKKALKGKLVVIDVPSPNRVEPRCTVFGKCGGCQWQHIASNAQAEWHQKIVSESLTRIGKLKDIPVQPIALDDAHAWNYRNNAQWVMDTRNRPGYYASGTHDVVAFDQCHIMPEAMNQLAKALTGIADIDEITVRQNYEGKMLLIISSDTLEISILKNLPPLKGLIVTDTEGDVREIQGEAHLIEKLGDFEFQVSWQSFFQTNTQKANETLQLLRSWMTPMNSLVDLYAGVGTWSIGLSKYFEEITLVESHPMAVTDAEVNLAKANLMDKSTLLEGDVEESLSHLPDTVDVTLVDPPRAGCTPAILDWMAAHTQKTIIYISCDPTTLARDLARLTGAGWRIETVQPIAMFPQTYHIETLVRLVPPLNN